MTLMPGAANKLLPNASKSRMSAYDIICIHTMVGSLTGTDGYFRKLTNGVNSHFGTGGNGEIWQWVDTAYRSGANMNGNHHVISIENADIGPGFPSWNTNDGGAVPAFTPAQVEAIAKIVAWACKTHNIPCELIPDAKPGRRGIGYHRQGVPGYMVAGAEKWSSAAGKVCPGNRRIAQIPAIIARAKQILNNEGDNIMPALNNDEQRELLNRLRRQSDVTERLLAELMGPYGDNGISTEQGHEVVNNPEGIPVRRTLLQMIAEDWREATFRLPSRVAGSDYRGTVLDYAANADNYGYLHEKRLTRLEEKLDKLIDALGAVNEVKPADPR